MWSRQCGGMRKTIHNPAAPRGLQSLHLTHHTHTAQVQAAHRTLIPTKHGGRYRDWRRVCDPSPEGEHSGSWVWSCLLPPVTDRPLTPSVASAGWQGQVDRDRRGAPARRGRGRIHRHQSPGLEEARNQSPGLANDAVVVDGGQGNAGADTGADDVSAMYVGVCGCVWVVGSVDAGMTLHATTIM